MRKYFIFISFLLGLSLIVNAVDTNKQNANFNPVNSIVKPGSKVAVQNVNTAKKQQKTLKENKQAAPVNEFIKQILDLQNQRREVSLQIYELRVQLIKSDPDLRILHKTIVDLHEKMAKQLNKNAKMEVYLAKAKKIDGQITDLIASKAKEMKKKK
jgi:thioredoxin-like negative regulator of GroEL